LLAHWARRAASLVAWTAGKSSQSSKTTIMRTINSSMSVKPRVGFVGMI
jgi:hypothetical protein